ncbi:MAG TPA: hypothetical protein VHB21_15190, partial [Minicystis sp.]|nr:hypothetical protein [Minicystis sp.]
MARDLGRRQRRSVPRAAIGVVALAASACLGLGACASDSSGGGGGGGGTGCQSNRAYFETQVWSPFMGSVCTKCHALGGLAIQKGAKLQLQPSTYPGFVDTNLASLTTV